MAGAASTDPLSAGSGRIESLSGDLLQGWHFDPLRPGSRSDLELLVDGAVVSHFRANRFREDLLRAGKGDGQHGFLCKIPDHFFDGSEHEIQVRIAGTNVSLHQIAERWKLDPAQLPQRRGALISIDNGSVVGYTADQRGVISKVAVDILRNGLVTETIVPSRTYVVEGQSAEVFNLPLSSLSGAAGETIQFCFAGTNLPLENPFGQLGGSSVVIEILSNEGRAVAGRVCVPGAVREDFELELCVNDKAEAKLFLREPYDGGIAFPFSLTIAPGSNPREIRLSVQQGGKPLGAGLTVSLTRLENLLADPTFAAWKSDGLSRWTLAPSLKAFALPGPLPASGAALSSNLGLHSPETSTRSLALRFDGAASFGPGQEILSQRFDISGLGTASTKVDLILALRASEHTELKIALVLVDQQGKPCRIEERVGAGVGWGRTALRLALPQAAGAFRSDAIFSLILAGPPPRYMQLAVVALGPAGFQAALSAAQLHAPASDGDVPTNAVMNGDFIHWAAPLQQTVIQRRLPCAANWNVAVKVSSPGLSVALDRISLREPAHGVPARPAYALELNGPINGSYARLEAELDLAQLATQIPREISFFASCRGGDSAIARIFVMRRRFVTGGETPISDDVVLTAARRVSLSKAGRFFSFAVDADKATSLRAIAEKGLGDSQLRLFLVFEIEGAADCRLAEVILGPCRRASQRAGKDEYLQFEDPRITAQLARLKLLKDWAAPSRIEGLDGRQAPAQALTPWHRPGRGFPSVDVVVCVYNALDEVLECLDSIVANTSVPYTLTVIDDASAPPVRATLQAFAAGKPWVRIKSNPANLGYTRSANIGLAGSDADWIVLLNSDTIVTPAWLEGMMACALSDPAIRFVGPLSNAASWQSVPEIKDSAGRWKVNQLPEEMTPADMAALVRRMSQRAYPRVPLLNGFCTLMEREALEALDFLDEETFPMGYGEENDLCLRALEAGFELAIADDTYVFHSKSASFGTSRRQELSKRGNQALAEKHPMLSIREVEAELASVAPINALRAALKKALTARLPEMVERRLERPAPAAGKWP